MNIIEKATNFSNEFTCYGLVDKDHQLLIEQEAFTGLAETARATAELLNSTQNLRNDQRAPYQSVRIYIEII